MIDLLDIPTIQGIEITDDTLSVDLSDGRTISCTASVVSTSCYTVLWRSVKIWRLIGKGEGIHWNQLDEDISVKNMILGQPSGESQESFQRWLTHRAEAG